MNEYITLLYGVTKMVENFSILRLLLIMGFAICCIIAWQSPHLIKAYLDYKSKDKK